MNVADVVFTEPAEYDLLDIEYYIFVDLCNPQAAQRDCFQREKLIAKIVKQ